jgi:hypothetical protein
MALQLRRGSDPDRQNIIPAVGELIYTTDTKLVYVGDGVSAGGTLIGGGVGGGTSIVTDTDPTLGGDLDLNTYNVIGTGNIDITGDIDTSGTLTSSIVSTDTIRSSTVSAISLDNNLNLNNNNIVGIGNINIDGTITATGNISLGDSTEDNVSLEGAINSNLTPQSDALYNIGSPSFRWATGYFQDIDVETISSANLSIDDLTVSGSINSNLSPGQDGTYTLGTEDFKWIAGYFDNALVTNLFTDSISGGSIDIDMLAGSAVIPDLLVDIIYGGDSSVFYDSFTSTLTVGSVIAASIEGTFQGEVLADDSTVIIDPILKSVSANELSAPLVTTEVIESELNALRIRSLLANSQTQVVVEMKPASTTAGEFLSAGDDWQSLVFESIRDGGDIASGDVLGVISWGGLQTSTQTEVANAMGVQADPAGTTTSTHIPTKYVWLNQPAVEGNSPVAMSFDSLGRLAINQENASATLDVNGFAKLAVLDTAPTSPQNGSIAIADGTGWNPLGTGVQQVVIYLDGVWKEFSSDNTVDGDLTGSVFGDDSALLVDGVNGLIVGEVDNDVVSTSQLNLKPYADDAARDAAITTPTAGQVVFVADADEFQVYNGTFWTNVSGTTKTVDDVAGTTYTVAATDLGKVLTFRDAGVVTVTLPDAAGTAIPVGGYVEIANMDGTNPITIDGTASQVVSKAAGAPSIPGFGSVRAVKLSTSEWLVTGDTA